MVRLWSLAILLASVHAQDKKAAKAATEAPKTTTKAPKTTTKATTTEAPKTTTKATTEAPKKTTTKDSTVPALFPTIDLFKSTASLSYALISDVITLDSSSYREQLAQLGPVVDVLHKVPELTGEVYRQTVEQVSSHAPAARDFIYEQAAAAEVHVITAKSLGKNLYKEHLSEHLDPHVASAQLFYQTQVSHHVDTALAQYADAHPVILNQSSRALTVAQEIANSATTNIKQQFDLYYPAAVIGASTVLDTVQNGAGYALHPIEIPVGKETLRFPNGIADMILAGVWIVFLLYLAFFVLRYSFGVIKCAFYTVKFIVFSVIFFILKTAFKIVTGIISFLWSTAFWFLGLFCFCWCCGTCGKRKGKGGKGSAPVGKAAVKGTTPAKPKAEPTPKSAPATKQDGKQKKKK